TKEEQKRKKNRDYQRKYAEKKKQQEKQNDLSNHSLPDLCSFPSYISPQDGVSVQGTFQGESLLPNYHNTPSNINPVVALLN
ncbi:hypothetical protein OFN60_39995, partial [Escherichia coli]|nr:hypothetical protein [Escherichia coli]